MVFTVSAGLTAKFGWIFTAYEISISGTSIPMSQRAYSWWSDPTSLIGILIFFLVFVSLVIAAWRSPEREERPQPQRLESKRVDIEVSVQSFVDALRSTDWETRREVVSALGNTGSVSAVDPLIGVLLHDVNERVRETAASWLGRIGGERAVPSLVKIVKNYLAGTEHAIDVVFTSATALGEIGSTEGLGVLKKLAESLEQSGETKNISKIARAVRDIELTNDLTNKKCIVCNLPLGRAGELVQCPFCKNIAHKGHMLEWLSRREYCPTCSKPITEVQLVPVKRRLPNPKPRTRSEAGKQ